MAVNEIPEAMMPLKDDIMNHPVPILAAPSSKGAMVENACQ
jgi:hypothetical protein